jgi:spermidine/putrescine transport system substrate-binding protein
VSDDLDPREAPDTLWPANPYSRKRFFQQTAGAIVGASSLAALLAREAGAASAVGRKLSAAEASQTINMLTWQGYHEQPWLDTFKKKTGITVNAVNVGSPAEMFAKVRANPGQYDVILATAGWFKNYADAKLLLPMDLSKVPNAKYISSAFAWRKATTVGGTLYGALYNWGDQPLGWNAKLIPGKFKVSQYMSHGIPNDWNIFWDPQFKGKVSIFDDPTSVEPMIPLALGYTDPYHLNSKQFTAFQNKLLALRPQVKRLTSGFNDQINAFVSGEASLGYINIAQVAVEANQHGVPVKMNHLVKQGVPAWSDNYAVTKAAGAKKLDAIHAFMDYTYSLPYQARLAAVTGNNGVLTYDRATSPEAKAAGLNAKKLAFTLIPLTKLGKPFFEKMIFFQDVENLQKRLDLWNQFKLGIH